MSWLVNSLNSWYGLIIAFVVGLIPLIVLHEIGHMLMAKWMGVWVREFGIGLPPRIVKLFRWKETEFTLNWIPFGGFARMEGEDILTGADTAEATGSESPERAASIAHSLYSKRPWRRILIYFGGPLANILTGWVIAVLIFMLGIPQTQVVVQEVAPDTPAQAADMRVDDVILAIDGAKITDYEQVSTETQKHLGSPMTITLERNGVELDVTLTPRENPPEGQGAMGIVIGGKEIPGSLRKFDLGSSLRYGTNYFARVSWLTLTLPIVAIRMGLPFREARPVGIIGISQITQYTMTQSIESRAIYPFLNLLTLLTVGLGIANLLPIPALDGGRILLTIIEKLRGKALSPALQERIHVIAFFILIALFVVITILDIVSPVPLP